MERVEPGPGQESVWDYPRPPALEPTSRRIRIVVAGVDIADSIRASRILETSHPPVYYLPPEDVRTDLLRPLPHRTFCEFKGTASYWSLELGARTIPSVAWSYPKPTAPYAAIRDHLAFYPGKVDEAWVDDERVIAQEGDFYGGWITSNVAGPFKGGPGTWGW